MITAKTFRFLADLKKNNHRDWFNANKPRYLEAKDGFEALVAELIQRTGAFDASVKGLDPRKSVFRIHRDTRFAKDKSPYKTHFGAHLSASKQDFHDRAGYYLHLEPGNSFFGGGAYQPSPEWLKAIRRAIDVDGGSLKKIVTSASFKKLFGALQGETLKKVPPGFRPDHLFGDLLRHKDFLAMHRLTDKDVLAPGFAKQATAMFKAAKPLGDFVNEALEDG